MPVPRIPRELTLDERKAAKAAFEGRAFDPRWSQAARRVYDGLVAALDTRQIDPPRLKETDPVPSTPMHEQARSGDWASERGIARPAITLPGGL